MKLTLRERGGKIFLCHCFLVLKYILTNIKLIFPKYSMFLSTKVNEKQSPSLLSGTMRFLKLFSANVFLKKGMICSDRRASGYYPKLAQHCFPFLFSLFRLLRLIQYFNSLNNYLLITISICLRVSIRHV